MPYLTSNLTWFTAAALIVVAALTIGMAVRAKRSQGPLAANILFGIWLIALTWVTLSANPSRSPQPPALAERFNFLALPQLYYAFRFGVPFLLPQIILNMVLFVPFGILVPWIWPNKAHWGWILLLGAILSTVVEVLQWIVPGSNRVFDPADILCNVFGAAVGFAVWTLGRIAKTKQRVHWKTAWSSVFICALFGLAGARPFLHLPTDIPMAESALKLPKRVIASNMDTIDLGPLPILRGAKDAIGNLQAGEMGLYDAGLVSSAKEYGLTQEAVFMCDLDQMILRAGAGAVVDAVASYYGETPELVDVFSAVPAYQMNINQDALIPVWVLEGYLPMPSSAEGFWLDTGDEIRWLEDGEEELITDVMREVTIIVPAI